MTTISFDVSDEALAVTGGAPEAFASAIRLAAARFWYGRGDLSMSAAAAVVGMSLREFMRALKEAGQDAFSVDLADLKDELAYLAERRSSDA